MKQLLLFLFILCLSFNSYSASDAEARKAYAEQLKNFELYKNNAKQDEVLEKSSVPRLIVNDEIKTKVSNDNIGSNDINETSTVILRGPELTEQKIKNRQDMQESILQRRQNLQETIANRRKLIQRVTEEENDEK